MAWCFSDQSANFRFLSYANQLPLKAEHQGSQGGAGQSKLLTPTLGLWASGWRFLCRTQAGSCFYVLPSSFAERVKSVSQRRLPSVVCTAASPQLRQSTQLFVVPAFPFLKGGGWLVETWNEVTLRSAGPLEGLSAMVTMGTAQGTQITLRCNSWVWARDLMYRLIWPWTLFFCCCCN